MENLDELILIDLLNVQYGNISINMVKSLLSEMGAFNQGVQAHSVEKRRDLNIKNLVKLLNNVYVNTYYFDFSRKLLSGSSDIRVPENQNDIQTKIAEIAMRNMIEYIKSNGKINH